MGIYMKIEGIEGDVTASSYEGCIELKNLDWGGDRNVSKGNGLGMANRVNAVSCKDLFFSKQIDSASCALIDLFFRGKMMKQVMIYMTRVYEGSETTLRSLRLENVIFSSFDNPVTEETLPSEHVSLSYELIEIADYGAAMNGIQKGVYRTIYDLRNANSSF
ncbi:type VI secretion system tube protein Hcp [Acetobacteraceae bacterium]|nr:type VI secretion system tube protein Hcp [Acetobacteraceae bacterium]